MTAEKKVVIVGRDGLQGTLAPGQALDRSDSQVRVHLDDGQQVWVPVDLLQEREDGTFYVPISPQHLETARQVSEREPDGNELVVIPVIEEQLRVGKRRTQTGVRITKHIEEREEVVDETGFVEEIEVERVPVDRVLEEPAQVRFEDDTMIIPIMEEVLVVEKRLMLKEEVRVTKYRETVSGPQRVTLRKEDIEIEQLPERQLE